MRRSVFLLITAFLCACSLAGCGSASPLDVAFRAHVTRVCRHVNTGSPVTRLGYAKQQRQDGMDIAMLARLHPLTNGERQTYGDLLMHLNRIHAFFGRNESRGIELNRATAHSGTASPATLRRVQRFLRPIAAETSAVFHDASALQLECPALVGL